MNDQPYTAVAAATGIAPGTAREVIATGRSVLICNSDGTFYAIENRCSHAEQPLEGGRIKAGWIACPFHGARFDLATGDALGPPAMEPIVTFPLRIVGGTIEIAI